MSASFSVDDELRFQVHEEFSTDTSLGPVPYGGPPDVQLGTHILRLQELDISKREPALLRSCPLQRAIVKDLKDVTRSSDLYMIYFEIRSPMVEAKRTLPISMEADVCVSRYAFASASGRPTKILLKASPLYTIQWRVITPMKIIQRKRLDVENVDAELMVSPVGSLLGERWKMRWENVVLRMSHGAHNAFIRRIIPHLQMPVELLVANMARARRFNMIRALASVQRKRVVRASVPQTIALRTLDQGEANSVRRVFIERERERDPASTFIHHHTTTLRRNVSWSVSSHD